LYSKYAKQLLLPFGFENFGPHDYRVYSEDEANLIALEFFENAFDNFKELNHLAGMYLSRLEATNLCERDAIGNENKHNMYAKDYSKYELMFEAYKHVGDERYCSYVPRSKGRNSLLVELVTHNQLENMFRTDDDVDLKIKTRCNFQVLGSLIRAF